MKATDIRGYADAIGERYFLDPTVEQVGSARVENFNLFLGIAAYLARGNLLIEGDPGFGKTTYANVVSSVLSGLPFDLFSSLQIQGHPEQTRESMLVRADLGRLAEEAVVWQPTVYLPAITLDEFNRLPPGKQSMILEFIRTGRIEYLGKVYADGKAAFYATLNPDAEGTFPINHALLDRFDLSVEAGYLGSARQHEVRAAEKAILAELSDRQATTKIVEKLLDKKLRDDEKRDYLATRGGEIGKRRELKSVPQKELEALYTEVSSIPLTGAALVHLDSVTEEANTTPLFGRKRRGDRVDTSTHNIVDSRASLPQFYANGCMQRPLSYRFTNAVVTYSQFLAASLGARDVGPEHVLAIVPYALAHRGEFTDDYAARFQQQRRLRGERQSMDLARRLTGEVKGRLDTVIEDIAIISVAIRDEPPEDPEIAKRASERLAHLMRTATSIDHPLLKRVVEEYRAMPPAPRKKGA